MRANLSVSFDVEVHGASESRERLEVRQWLQSPRRIINSKTGTNRNSFGDVACVCIAVLVGGVQRSLLTPFEYSLSDCK